MAPTHRKKWLRFGVRALYLLATQKKDYSKKITRSYDSIAKDYDEAVVSHNRAQSLDMLKRLKPKPGGHGLDLNCGTGFVAINASTMAGATVVGVDISKEMIVVAKKKGEKNCTFVRSDVITFLKKQEPDTFDFVTTAWGLGYSKPDQVLKEVYRVLRPGGRVGIIDNSLYSFKEVYWASVLAFAEHPEALEYVQLVRFVRNKDILKRKLKHAGFKDVSVWNGEKTYYSEDKDELLTRLLSIGAAAGFEHAVKAKHRRIVFERFKDIYEQRYGTEDGIPSTHRFIGGVGKKP